MLCDFCEPILQGKLNSIPPFSSHKVSLIVQVSDFPSDYPPFTPDHSDRQPDGSIWTPDAVLNRGGSCIVGPLGTFLAEPVWDKEDIMFADLNMEDLIESRVCIFDAKMKDIC
jgi:hypothetical protein